MTAGFGPDQAEVYDLIYRDKDYETECDFLERVWDRFRGNRPKTVLDVGCGTGGHGIPLARRGYQVTGIDASASMVAVARRKAEVENLPVRFYATPVEQMEFSNRWDTAICLFNALDYVVDEAMLIRSLGNIRRHLHAGGLFLFDYRNGIASLRSFSPTRVKWMEDLERRVLRISDTRLKAMEQLFHTTCRYLVFEGGKLVKEFQDEHLVRFLFPREVERYLRETGFEWLHSCPFLELDRAPTEEDWNVMVVARAV